MSVELKEEPHFCDTILTLKVDELQSPRRGAAKTTKHNEYQMTSNEVKIKANPIKMSARSASFRDFRSLFLNEGDEMTVKLTSI